MMVTRSLTRRRMMTKMELPTKVSIFLKNNTFCHHWHTRGRRWWRRRPPGWLWGRWRGRCQQWWRRGRWWRRLQRCWREGWGRRGRGRKWWVIKFCDTTFIIVIIKTINTCFQYKPKQSSADVCLLSHSSLSCGNTVRLCVRASDSLFHKQLQDSPVANPSTWSSKIHLEQ